MDIYDHIQGEIFSTNNSSKRDESQNETSTATTDRPAVDLNTELQETFRAFSASPWGTRIGGLWSNVRKQGESYYEGARQEYAAASEEAAKGFTELRDSIVGRTRGLSLSTAFAPATSTTTATARTSSDTTTAAEKGTDETATPTKESGAEGTGESHEGQQKGAPTTDQAGGESLLSRIKAEASRRLKEIEKAEEAADEAILRFGLSISQKLRDAISIVPPDEESSSKLLFESKDSEGKRVIHATRFEAQLHVIHSNLDSFLKDPVSDQWPAFKESFNVDDKTAAITADLEKYPDLRSAMEKVVPEQVQYAQFWCRYYFLRLVIETEEQKRKELLKGANVEEDEEVGWDDDSDDDTDSPSTPQVSGKQKETAQTPTKNNTLKPNEPRRSNDQVSQADSESSYDLVSGATSRTPASPKEKSKDDDSDDDWE